MSWQLLLYINLAAGTIRELLNKKISNTVSLFAGLFYITLFAQVFFYVSWVFTSQTLPRYDLYASLCGILIVAGFSFYFAALRISLTQSILFQSYSILVTILLSAVFLGESKYFDIRTFSGIKVVSGTILAFLALWFLLHQKNKKEERLEKKWLYYIAGTILFLGIGSFASISFIHKLTPTEIFINQANTMIPLYLVLIFIGKEKLSIGKKMLAFTFINALVSAIAIVAFYKGLLLMPVAKFYPLQQLSLVILTMITGWIFYHEKDFFSKEKLRGLILGLAGMLLLITS